jgi:putative oxidoreductase
MENGLHRLFNILVALLIGLWTYAALSKLINVEQFNAQLKAQPFGKTGAAYLKLALPIGELIIAIILFVSRTKTAGLYISGVLLTVFSAYILLILVGYYPQVPCACGGILGTLGWGAHFAFNIAFLAINLYLIHIQRKEVARH